MPGLLHLSFRYHRYRQRTIVIKADNRACKPSPAALRRRQKCRRNGLRAGFGCGLYAPWSLGPRQNRPGGLLADNFDREMPAMVMRPRPGSGAIGG